MKTLLLFLFAFICCNRSIAQERKFVIVQAGNNITDVLSPKEMFHFLNFTPGKVVRRDGSVAEGKLNYNRLVDEMHFINREGDTLSLTNEENIKYVAIGNDTFYYAAGFARLLSARNPVKLAVKQVWVISEGRLRGAYNSTNTSVSITSFTSYHQGGRLYDLTVNEEVVLKPVENYYFGDKDNNFVLAGKKELLMLFPQERSRIEMYLKENKINFKNKHDLEKVVDFLQHL